jgi:hypothetical protein
MRSWDSLLTPAEREKMRKFKRQEQAHRQLPSVRILAELGDVYGWQAIRDVLENKVDSDLMMRLLRESRNIRRKHLADQYRMTFECVAAAFSKCGDRKINAIIEKLGKDV